jgi:hypothetical protein
MVAITIATSRFLTILSLSFMMLILMTGEEMLVSAAGSNYRLGATKYSLSMTSTLEMKNENCRTNFGDGSSLVDMDAVKQDFDSEADFNQALATVFFKQPTTAFMVLYKGNDSPPDSKDPNLKYAIRTDKASSGSPSIAEFGHARVIVYNHEAPILCTVPTTDASQQGATTRKAYVPKDATTNSNNNNNTSRRVVFGFLVMGIVGIAIVARNNKSNLGTYYYNLLGSEAPRHHPRGYPRLYDHDEDSGDLGANFLSSAACELSYHPAATMAAPTVPIPGVV